MDYYDISPGDILPSGIDVDTSANTKVINGVLNTNWNGRFCEALTTVLLCPIFFERPQYIQLIIKLAVEYCLGASDSRQFSLNVNTAGFPMHKGFLNHLPRAVRAMQMVNESDGIILGDLKSIEEAWDNYVAANVADEDLKSLR